MQRYRTHNLAEHDRLIRTVPGAAHLIADLQRARIHVGIVSSKFADTVRLGMRITALPEVEVVIGLEATSVHKPDPEPLLLGARRLGVLPQECVYVEALRAVLLPAGLVAG